MRGNRALHDLAMVGRLELQTNFAALLAVLRRLMLGIGVRDCASLSSGWARAREKPAAVPRTGRKSGGFTSSLTFW